MQEYELGDEDVVQITIKSRVWTWLKYNTPADLKWWVASIETAKHN